MLCDNNENKHRHGVIVCKICGIVYGCATEFQVIFCCQCKKTDCSDKVYKQGVCRLCRKSHVEVKNEPEK